MMHTFKDNAGAVWTIQVSVSTVKRVNALTGVDLLAVLDGTLIDKLANDPILLCNVLYAVLKPEADARGVSDEAFGAAMSGDAIESATDAFLDDLIDFFPQARRNLLRKAMTKYRAVKAKALTEADAKLDSLIN